MTFQMHSGYTGLLLLCTRLCMRVSRLFWEPGVPGSNPGAPTEVRVVVVGHASCMLPCESWVAEAKVHWECSLDIGCPATAPP
jgi:hypothetical protein